jgi:hypothetical protein
MQLQSKTIESIKGRLRRNRTLMQLIRGRQVPAAKGQLRIDQAKLRNAIRNNRGTLKTVTNWVDPDSFEKSVCAYGMSLSTRGVINDDISPQTTYSDLMAYLCDYRDNAHERYYPVKTADGRYQAIYETYRARAKDERELAFIGRCGTYQYLDMDQVINQSLTRAEMWLRTA